MKASLTGGQLLTYIKNPDKSVADGMASTSIIGTRYYQLLIGDTLKFTGDLSFFPVIFSECDFNEIIFEDLETNHIWFRNCIFNGPISIEYCKLKDLNFQNCEFNEKVHIYSGQIDFFTLEENTSKFPIRISGGFFDVIRYITYGDKETLAIDGLYTSIKKLDIFSLIGSNITVFESVINEILIKGNFNSSSRLNFNKIKTTHFTLDDINNDGKIFITNIDTRDGNLGVSDMTVDVIENFRGSPDYKQIINAIDFTIKFNKARQFKTILEIFNSRLFDKKHIRQFHDLIIDGDTAHHKLNQRYATFEISNSSVGHLEMKNIDTECYKFKIQNSDLSLVKLINTKFPTEVDRVTCDNLSSLNNYNLYNDLYSAASRQNNSKDKIEYYSTSQKYLYRYVENQNSSLSKYSTLISIWISAYFSNHGDNWLKAVIKTLGLGLVFFIIYITSLNNYSLDLSIGGLSYYWSSILPKFPEFLNPLHKIDFLTDSKYLGFWSGWIDLLARILIGIGIYETIRAFRKYVRP